jgi:hypothetical protein
MCCSDGPPQQVVGLQQLSPGTWQHPNNFFEVILCAVPHLSDRPSSRREVTNHALCNHFTCHEGPTSTARCLGMHLALNTHLLSAPLQQASAMHMLSTSSGIHTHGVTRFRADIGLEPFSQHLPTCASRPRQAPNHELLIQQQPMLLQQQQHQCAWCCLHWVPAVCTWHVSCTDATQLVLRIHSDNQGWQQLLRHAHTACVGATRTQHTP